MQFVSMKEDKSPYLGLQSPYSQAQMSVLFFFFFFKKEKENHLLEALSISLPQHRQQGLRHY